MQDTSTPVSTANKTREDVLILLVDDDDLFLNFCNRMLEREDFNVHTANNGKEGLEKVQEHHYDVILLDVSMPYMDGITCLKQLQETKCDAAVIMVTGRGDVQTAVEAMKHGAADFIEKPFSPNNLLVRIDEALAEREKAREANSNARSREPVVAYIEQHSAQINSRKDAATALGLSMDQVSTRIQKSTGQSFRQLLHLCRLKTAVHLLETTETEISHIAQRTGFATVQHFSRVFSNVKGISPRKYRQQSRLGNLPATD